MKLFNPFKIHLATIGDYFVVRRWFIVWWYKDTADDYWWADTKHITRWSLFTNKDRAMDRLNASKLKIRSKYYEN